MKGVVPIRRKRLKTYHRPRLPGLLAKIALINVALYMTFAQLNSSGTSALFNDIESYSFGIQVPEEKPPDQGCENNQDAPGCQDQWDKSSLTFEGLDTGFDADRQVIWAIIKNKGSDMTGPSEFDVFYNGESSQNPIKFGEKLTLQDGEGIVPKLKSGETAKLEIHVDKNGTYKFQAYQRPCHAHKCDERQALAADSITVQLKEQTIAAPKTEAADKKEATSEPAAKPADDSSNVKQQVQSTDPAAVKEPENEEKQAESTKEKQAESKDKEETPKTEAQDQSVQTDEKQQPDGESKNTSSEKG